MLRFLKRSAWVGVLAASQVLVPAFVFLGPNNEAYQTTDVGYNPNPFIDLAPSGPKDIGEEYRRNMPVLFYACDQNFLDYFGANGLAAIDAAVAVFNGLTNVSQYSADLSEFPMEAQAVNYRAQALGLTDLKSTTMGILIEQLGLASPERYVWTLHSRFRLLGNPPPCPEGQGYYVIRRNFDPFQSSLDQFQSSSYVNGTLYGYSIREFCDAATSPIPPLLADAAEFPVDPLDIAYKAIASLTPAPRQIPVLGQLQFTVDSGLTIGGFFTGLTRDDVGGLRALMRTNNVNFESTGPNTSVAATNLNANQLLFTSNLTLLVTQGLTNNAAALAALFPGLVISSTTPIFTNVVTTNVVFSFTNLPWSPAGTAATLVTTTNLTTNVVTWFSHTVANVRVGPYFTNGFLNLTGNLWPFTNGFITTLDTTVGPRPFGLPGQIYTNVTATTVFTNLINGEYFILPANSDCGAMIVSTQLTLVSAVTNLVVVATNAPGTTNLNGQSFTREQVFYSTNHVFVINPVPCVVNPVGLNQGIERVRFVRRDFDSLLGQFYEPITNVYTLFAVTNSTVRPRTVLRQVTQPDILFTAQDMTSTTADNFNVYARTLPFNTANALPNLAGPGTLEPSTIVTFNKLGPFYDHLRLSPSLFLDELTSLSLLTWASFDATTNAPVIYPNGTSIAELEYRMLIQIFPGSLPVGKAGTPYTATFSVTGGTSPYTWSLSPGTPDLPPGLQLLPNGTIIGTPTESGVYDIVIRLTDGGMRSVDQAYAIIINP